VAPLLARPRAILRGGPDSIEALPADDAQRLHRLEDGTDDSPALGGFIEADLAAVAAVVLRQQPQPRFRLAHQPVRDAVRVNELVNRVELD